ncbi:acyltransferase family protein [Leuconostoc miyukkimchii]|uniref:acyltransferase family protein n=1 Tax=Leuconostoc miyukkimchii TaxID=910540 RepID=UPI001C7D1A2E|nr:acyltransferase family protein [Leuconostoc miyukkimchii]
MSAKYDVLDVFKLIAAFFVVGIHAWPLPDINSNIILFQGLGRFAVPFFLLSSGFLLEKKLQNVMEKKVYILQYVKRLFLFYVAWWITYLWLTPLTWGGVYRFEGQQGIQLFKSILNQYIFNFFTGSTFIGSWYISATIIGIVIVFIMFDRISYLMQFLIGVTWFSVLLVILLQGNKISSITIILKYLPHVLPAETFLVAVPFLIFGRIIARYEEKLNKIPIALLTVTVIGLLPVIAKEIFFWRSTGSTISNEQLFFADILAMVVLIIAINTSTRKIQIPSAKHLRGFSSFVYMGQFGLLILAPILHKYFGIMFSKWTMYTVIILLLFLLFETLNLFSSKRMKFIKYLW